MNAVLCAVVIPLKSFDLAKGRLADALTPTERAEMAQTMATSVLGAAKGLPTWVVCGDRTVAAWALGNGAGVLWRPPAGLNDAVAAGAAWCSQEGHDRVIVAHGDLPLARDLAWLATETSDVVIVTDRRRDGSNVVVLPTGVDFRFAYGPDSAAKHVAEANRLGLSVDVVVDDELSWDVDVPEDLRGLPR